MITITLSNITKHTQQEVFDKCSKHLLSQNKRSSDEDDDVCLYRGDGNLTCAVGCFISDEEYFLSMEQEGITAEIFHKYFTKDVNDTRSFLNKLQYLHDFYKEKDWKEKLKELAEEYKLETT
jgi:hypothetical protein